MRAALLVIVLVACSKQAVEPRPEQPAEQSVPVIVPEGAKTLTTPTTTGAPPPSGGGGGARGSAVDQARASGVLGPTDRAAFEVKGTIAIKSANRNLAKVVESKRDALQACYDKALEFQDRLAGELVLRVEAGKVAVQRSTLKHAELETCVIDALATAGVAKATKATVTLAFTRG